MTGHHKVDQAKLTLSRAVKKTDFAHLDFDVICERRGHLIFLSAARDGVGRQEFMLEISFTTGQIYKATDCWSETTEDWSGAGIIIDLRDAELTDTNTLLHMATFINTVIAAHIFAINQSQRPDTLYAALPKSHKELQVRQAIDMARRQVDGIQMDYACSYMPLIGFMVSIEIGKGLHPILTVHLTVSAATGQIEEAMCLPDPDGVGNWAFGEHYAINLKNGEMTDERTIEFIRSLINPFPEPALVSGM